MMKRLHAHAMREGVCVCVLPDQAVVRSARTLADISDERVVPVDYLGVLILLFMLMVLDRLCYTLGAHLGKVCMAAISHSLASCPKMALVHINDVTCTCRQDGQERKDQFV